MSTSRSYTDAIEALNSLQTNAATLEAVRQAGGKLNPNAMPEMLDYLKRIGYTAPDLNKLNVIHITGTKGKGSTSAFTDSLLRSARPDWKVGLYTSPHLVAVRERIRVNGKPISEEDFATFFFEVWDRLKENDARENSATPPMPNYFRYLTLMAFHTFLSLKVDATILEVGIGGASDSTNVVPKPVVTGVTALGLDHVSLLGKTIGEIAWQKGGIYKPDVPAFSVEQPEEGMKVLKERAQELEASRFQVSQVPSALRSIKLGLAGKHQISNASIALDMAHAFLESQSPENAPSSSSDGTIPDVFVKGLETAAWPGRCQTVADPNAKYSKTTWYLDGAHTVESLDCCMEWFVQPGVGLPVMPPSSRPKRAFIFNCTNGRSGPAFLGTVLAKINAQLKLHGYDATADTFFNAVVFCNNVTYADGGFKGDLASVGMPTSDLVHLKTQHELADAWMALIPSFPKESVHVLPSIEHAVRVVRGISSEKGSQEVNVLVAGSLHLVGGMVEVAGLSSVAL
ncbi:FolC bifunctional protein [Coniophora puteana RWD-64-598 SS2]|uniref:Folylpolyglutamate synthase n=1 Tax=Coniophora puteana (strain RWD-64-598) TaxID=741705 RepID=A0A5M3MUP2_CONPW|nr:FolC bifunctional protein [Coniophora puteana RWD-64-598 SS2]EIW82321.1 FolC bifunctional protein [Coniophora puteana RWD-64-598 SS2]